MFRFIAMFLGVTLFSSLALADVNSTFFGQDLPAPKMSDAVPYGWFDSMLCEPMGQIGAGIYISSAAEQARRNSGHSDLDEYQKALYRPYFGDLVDRVQIYYSAYLLDTMTFKIGKKRFEWIEGSAGITFGRNIYLNYSYSVGYGVLDSLLAHELIHVKQWEENGESDYSFGRDYFNDWCKSGFDYYSNKWEEEAYDFETRFY
ncbi:MAG: hypothetical protein EOP04_07545 [Proteobacteria bacterium]|nr:MAG: hypothetical protein EOP04_07545 [Pseudomonadota bacterium]